MTICDCGVLAKPLKVTREGEVPRCGRCYSPMVDPQEFAAGYEREKAEKEEREAEIRARQASFLVVTTDDVPGYRVVTVLGQVHDTASTTNQSTEDKKGIWNTQEKRMAWSVDTAIARMIDKALAKGANAIIGMAVAVNESEGSVSSWRSTGAVVWGTAVVVERE